MYPCEAIDFERHPMPRATQARIRERVGGLSEREAVRNDAHCHGGRTGQGQQRHSPLPGMICRDRDPKPEQPGPLSRPALASTEE